MKEQSSKKIEVGVLTNKGRVLKEIHTKEEYVKLYGKLWETDTIVNGEGVDFEDDCFWEKDLKIIE